MKHLKKTIALMGLAGLLAAMLAGCGSKDITSKADKANGVTHDGSKLLEDNFGGLSMKATKYTLEVAAIKADRAKLKAGSVKELFDGNQEAYMSDSITYQPVYEAEGYDDVYVAFISPEPGNGVVVDYELYSNGKTDSVEVDTENGIVYIPKALYPKEDDGDSTYSLGIQLLMGVDMAELVEKE